MLRRPQRSTRTDTRCPCTTLCRSEGTTDALVSEQTHNEERSLWAIFIAGCIGGFAALLMPCIFPLLPLTVSYVTKSSHTRGKAVIQASVYDRKSTSLNSSH